MISNYPLVSVVVLCYKQEQYLANAVESVLRQNYPSIELHIADDGTPGFQTEQWEQYVKNRAGENIAKCSVCTQANAGTVRNLNGALNRATGKYVLFFAGDDALFGTDCLKSLVEQAECSAEDHLCFTALASKMDSELKTSDGYFQPKELREKGSLSSKEAHRLLLYSCCYSMGATLFRRERFLENGGFSEEYHVIEDWSFYLSHTRKGGTIGFCDIPFLMHRQGGISEKHSLPPVYLMDLKRIYLTEVFPFVKEESNRKRRVEIILHYKSMMGIDRHFLNMCLRNAWSILFVLKLKLFGGSNG